MAVGWCLQRRLRREKKKKFSLWPSTEGPSREGSSKYHRWLCAAISAVLPLMAEPRVNGGSNFDSLKVSPSHPSHAVDIFCARPSMAVGWCLHRRLRRNLRRTKERSIRTRPSTASRRSFLLSRRCRHQPTVVEGSAQMSLTEWEGW
jgi:hypothetical protein